MVVAGSVSELESFVTEHDPTAAIIDADVADSLAPERFRSLVDDGPIIITARRGTVADAVAAIRRGAADYIVKPVAPDDLRIVLERALEAARLRRDHEFVRMQLAARTSAEGLLVGGSAPMQRLRDLIGAVAVSNISVLLQGESGSGKELVAHAIHRASERAHHNCVAVDCTTLQDTLFESELFGYERGSFTGAERQKKGLIESAEGGTLFLDEIGEISPTAQAKLLRVLETSRFRRVGGTKDLKVDVRFIAATNRDLFEMARQGRFREDLYYRLNGYQLAVPPLRDRRDDVPALANFFLQTRNFQRQIDKAFAPGALHRLVAHDWPGNVRELRNVIERAVIDSGPNRLIREEHLAFGRSATKVELIFDHDPTIDELVDHYVALQMRKLSGQRAQVAKVCGVSERSIYRMLQRNPSLDDES